MNTDDSYISKISPLAQRISRQGKTIQVEIYDDGSGRWLLEVVDDHNNSVVWEDLFDSDQEALDEVINTIETEGIDSLIGSASESAH